MPFDPIETAVDAVTSLFPDRKAVRDALPAAPVLDEEGRTVIERVLLILNDHLCLDEERITTEAELVRDLECDSLDLLEITMALEDEFGVEIADDELAEGKPKTVQQVADLVTQRLGEVAVRP